MMASHKTSAAAPASRYIAHKQAPLALAALLLAVLPGCFTGNLWDMGRTGAYELIGEEHIEQTVDARLISGHTPSWFLRTHNDPSREPIRDLWMSPRIKAREAVALMSRPELFEVQSNIVTGECAVRSGVSIEGKATLDLTGRILSTGWRSDVAEQDLSALVRARMNEAMTARLPQALRECGERLTTANVELLFPEAGPTARVTGYVFVDQSNAPLPHAADPAPLRDGATSYTHRFAHLKACTLFAKLQDGDRERILRIDPDAFWLLSGLTPHQGIAAHRSNWRIDIGMPHGETLSESPTRQLNVNVCVRSYKKPDPPAAVRLVQVVLTPAALLADLLITVPVIVFLMATGALDNVQ
jgi:hypothetical protein